MMQMAWALLAAAGLLLEGVGLGRPEKGDTLSECVRAVRYDTIGRFALLPLATWLAWHWFLKPNAKEITFDWRDIVALGLGFAWAIVESVRK